jgi:hypothetical protein
MNYYPRAICDLLLAFEDYGRVPASGILPVGIYLPGASDGEASKYVDTTIPTLFSQHSIKVKKYKLERANLRVADQLEITIPYKDAPYDPEIIRGAIITLYAGNVVDATGSDQQELTDQWRLKNLQFTGVVDDWHTEHDEEGHWINVTARDFTAYFIDAYYPANIKIKINGTILDVIQSIVNTLKLGTDFIVVADDYPNGINNVKTSSEYGNPLPSPGKDLDHGPESIADLLNISNAQSGVKDQYASMNMPYKMDVSYWDVITTICNLEGFVPYITGEISETTSQPTIVLHLRRASDIYAENTNPPYLMWGNNIKSIHIERKLGMIKAPVVLAMGHNINAKTKHSQTIYATYPKNAFSKLFDQYEQQQESAVTGIRATLVDPKGKLYKAEIKTYVFPNVKSKDTLQNIAENIYHEIGRQELGGKLTTYELNVLNKNSGSTDIFDLRSGSQIELQVQPLDLSIPTGVDELSFIRNAPSPEIVNYLVGLGYSSQVATDLADAIKNPFFMKEYKIKSVVFIYDIDSGLAIEIEFSNYIFQRAV